MKTVLHPPRIALYLSLTLGALMFAFPFVWMLSTALKPDGELFTQSLRLIPENPQWGQFAQAWNYLPFGQFYVNSVVVAVCSTALVILTSSLAAYAFARIRFPGRDAIFLVYLGTMMIPFQVTMIPTYIMMLNFGWLNTYAALIIPGAFTAGGTFLLRQFFLGIPMEFEEAAFMEGSGRFRSWSTVILPLAKPALVSLAVFSFIGNWNSFLYPLLVTDSENMKTLTTGMAMFVGQHFTSWNLMMAAACFCILPPIAVFLFFQRHFVQGITVTGFGGR